VIADRHAVRYILCTGTHPATTPHTMGAIADTLRATLRDMAAADARIYRGLAAELGTTSQPALPADEIRAAITLLERHGYTVSRG
jgi:hypothetical protein